MTDFPVVCANGCPGGVDDQHKMSCEWAGHDPDRPMFPDAKLRVNLAGPDGNTMVLIGLGRAALKNAGHGDQRDYFSRYVMAAHSGEDALERICRWIDLKDVHGYPVI